MIGASDGALPRYTFGMTGGFDGDPYGDEAPVYRGLSLPSASFTALSPSSGLSTPCASFNAGVPTCGLLNAFDFELSSTARISGASYSADPVSSCIIRVVALSPKALRSSIIEHIRMQGEAEVQLSEKHDLLKAKVQIFVESTQEVLGMAIRIRAGSDGASAEWRRHKGDALQFHRFFLEVKDAVEAPPVTPSGRAKTSKCFQAASNFPVTSLEDAIATAQVMPEEAAAALARSIPDVDASEVAKLPRYIGLIQDWLMATDVRVVGPACSLAEHICKVDRTCAPTLMETAVEQAEMSLDETPIPTGQLEMLRPRLLLRLAARLA
jgi:hypothetical protein